MNQSINQSAQEQTDSAQPVPVKMIHVELVHHLSSETMKALSGPVTASCPSFHGILQFGIDAPFLMDELLSLSALHISIVRPNKRDFYRYQSTHLQNYALGSFNGSSSQINEKKTSFQFSSSLLF